MSRDAQLFFWKVVPSHAGLGRASCGLDVSHPSSSVYWDYAMTIRLEEIVYLHCHQQGRDCMEHRYGCSSWSPLLSPSANGFTILSRPFCKMGITVAPWFRISGESSPKLQVQWSLDISCQHVPGVSVLCAIPTELVPDPNKSLAVISLLS